VPVLRDAAQPAADPGEVVPALSSSDRRPSARGTDRPAGRGCGQDLRRPAATGSGRGALDDRAVAMAGPRRAAGSEFGPKRASGSRAHLCRSDRRQQVAVPGGCRGAYLYEEAGRPVPPPDDVLALHREGLVAELRALQTTSKFAELAAAGCCVACRQDDGRSFPIAAELKARRLPHEECPKGLCGCDWFIAKAPPPKRRRRRTQSAVTP
jgi:hypothetical protein